VHLLKLLRMLMASAAATTAGVMTMVAGTAGRGDVELKPGDPAPAFELPGSDGRVHRLSEILGRGRAVVIAWFPKAFTGG
jgi:peroxiredoxin Q/BCP